MSSPEIFDPMAGVALAIRAAFEEKNAEIERLREALSEIRAIVTSPEDLDGVTIREIIDEALSLHKGGRDGD